MKTRHDASDLPRTSSEKTTGWMVGQSVPLELDTVLTTFGGYFQAAGIPPEVVGMLESLPADWLAEWSHYLGEEGRFVSLLYRTADLAGVAASTDYSQATIAMRELTLESALAHLAHRASVYGIDLLSDDSPAESLVELGVRLSEVAYAAAGLRPTNEVAQERETREEFTRVSRILRDGDLHARFWHWLDRFYYEIYGPWRRTRMEALEALEQHATVMLGAKEKWGTPPATGWLPPQNPLVTYRQLLDAVQSGQFRVFFWADPFQLGDLLVVQPGQVLVTFSEPGPLDRKFEAYAAELASRAKALSDPTRLTILRLIRHFGMMNTEIANFLELARPTVSVHAKILREAGLIQSHQQGREIRHEIVPAEVRRLFADLEGFLDLPDPDDA